MSVVHVGNDPYAQGGISSVVRNRLESEKGSLNVVTYRADGSGLFSQFRVYLTALISLVKLDAKHEYHFHISQRGSIFREGSLLLLSRVLRRNTYFTLHGSSSSRPGRFQYFAVRILARASNKVHFYGTAYAEVYQIPLSHIRVIPNSVKTPSAFVDVLSKEHTFLFLGEVGPRKGVDILVKAWELAKLEGWTLKIVGPFAPEYAATRPELDGVTFVGPVPFSQVPRILNESRILLQPSRAEAFPVSMCEALAYGLPVIGSDVGAMATLLGESEQICLSPITPESLAEAMRELADDEALQETRSRNGRKYAETEFSTVSMAAKWRDFYNG